ncbi:MAG TPA: hypothetical protein VIJ94_07955, partial [Caulobacteraceae bacterium]
GPLSLRERAPAPPRQPLAREALSRPAPFAERGLSPRLRGDERTQREPGKADDELFEIIEPVLRAARGGR